MFWALTHCLFSNFRKRCLNIWKHLIETLEEAHPSLPANWYKNPCYLFCTDHFVSHLRVVFLRSIARSFKYEVLDNKNCFKEALKCTVWPALDLLPVQNRKVRTDAGVPPAWARGASHSPQHGAAAPSSAHVPERGLLWLQGWAHRRLQPLLGSLQNGGESFGFVAWDDLCF